MVNLATDSVIVGAKDPVGGGIVDAPTHETINEKSYGRSSGVSFDGKKVPETKIEPVAEADETSSETGVDLAEVDSDDIIKSGADAALRLLPMRDDFDPAVTFRSIFLASILSCFQAVMSQIYNFKPTSVSIQGTFIVLIAYFAGNGWARFLPRGDLYEARWRAKNGDGPLPTYIKVISFFNYGIWGLKEHAICAITATSASNGSAAVTVFTAQNLYYGIPLTATTVILATLSIGLFGYGVAGLLRPICVWHVESVYWSTLPTVKVLQGLHWQNVKDSKPLRWFWYAFGSMFCYEFFPAYMFPWLNSVSIPCLASMKATGDTATTLTNIFGGSVNNEGLGLFTFSFDWQYITSFQTSLPLKFQYHQAVGYFVCYLAMLGIYYQGDWSSKTQAFMSTRLHLANGTVYPVADVFVEGVLDEAALAEYGAPRLTATFAYAMFMANAAIGALFLHCILFWGKDIVRTIKDASKGRFDDRHHQHMAKHYKEVPWHWYAGIMFISFILGLVVVLKEDITLPVWAYIISIVLGIVVAPFSAILYSRYGNGIATNNLSKMIAGLMIPGRPVGNMYFAAWSHNVILNAINMCNDLKMGEYLKIAPRTMLLTQLWGTVLGAFVNYVVMISIVTSKRALLLDSNGDSDWSGATIQAYNTNATSWALAKYLYRWGDEYYLVPLGIVVGAAFVIAHKILTVFVPRIRGFALAELNLPQLIQYAAFIPYDQSQTCIIASTIAAGFVQQFYLRNYHPKIFKNYAYLITGAWDGAALTVLFILSFAVFGAGGPTINFPSWWGNNVDGTYGEYYDLCPSS